MTRRKDSIRLSERHGVNPSLGVCFYCNEDNGEIILPGRLKGDVEAPRKAVWHKHPCDKCAGYMKQGIILISVNEKKSTDMDNPYRTGGWCVVKPEAIKRWSIDQAMCDSMLKHRFAWMEDEVWDLIGLPRGDEEIDNTEAT